MFRTSLISYNTSLFATGCKRLLILAVIMIGGMFEVHAEGAKTPAPLQSNAESVAPYKGSRIFWDTTTRQTVFSNGGYSRIIQLQDGRLMAVCEHTGINIAFSSNMGKSWTSPIKIVNNPSRINECVPDLIQLSDGTIIVAYNPRPQEPYSEDRKFGIRCKYSTDNGATWSEEIFVHDAHHTFADGCWEPSMLELPSGELQLYFADEGPYTNSNEQQISLTRSFDKGKTWSTPQKVSFRAGYRDGMPAPILLKDQSEIVYAFEDNGWGYGDFFPTTARCSLEKNWNNYWVNSSSSNRQKTLDPDYCPAATGGAPYLCQLPNGETVISWQSTYNSSTGKLTMITAVGDERAQNFKSLSHPFIISGTTSVLWNSVAVIDTGVVVAVGSVDNHVEIIKGYPKTMFECAYGSPVVDGKMTKNEGYYNANCSQVRMGTETGTITLCDYAYDRDSLYFVARVSDRTPMESGAYADGIRLFIETEGKSDNRPQTTTYQYYVKLNGTCTRLVGTGASYKTTKTDLAHVCVNATSSYYIIELAIPWEDMGLSGVPTEKNLRTNIEIRNGDTSGLVTETIPDANTNYPWTWMVLHMADIPEEDAVKNIETDDSHIVITADGNEFNIRSSEPIENLTIYSIDGRKVGYYTGIENAFRASSPIHGMAVMQLELQNGRTVNRKIVL